MTLAPIQIRGHEFIPEKGAHSQNGKACVMELVAYWANEPWSDHPACASPVVGAFCRSLWDRQPKSWPGLLERVERIAGSASTSEVEKARGYLAHDWLVRRFAPRWLRRAGLEEDAAKLEALPPVTDTATAKAARKAAEGARDRAYAKRQEAWKKHAATYAAATYAAATYATYAAADALKGKTYSQKVAWFRERIDAALADELEASMADGFQLLDAMLDLQPVPDKRPETGEKRRVG